MRQNANMQTNLRQVLTGRCLESKRLLDRTRQRKSLRLFFGVLVGSERDAATPKQRIPEEREGSHQTERWGQPEGGGADGGERSRPIMKVRGRKSPDPFAQSTAHLAAGGLQ